jgi:hypothetical protein
MKNGGEETPIAETALFLAPILHGGEVAAKRTVRGVFGTALAA